MKAFVTMADLVEGNKRRPKIDILESAVKKRDADILQMKEEIGELNNRVAILEGMLNP